MNKIIEIKVGVSSGCIEDTSIRGCDCRFRWYFSWVRDRSLITREICDRERFVEGDFNPETEGNSTVYFSIDERN